MLERMRGSRSRELARPDKNESADGCSREIEELHYPIIEFCNNQHPKWKYIHSRPDQRSTIGEGVQDFTIFAPGGRVFLIECKTRTGKPSEDQRNWAHEMEMIGWIVQIVRSYKEFLELVTPRSIVPQEIKC